MVFWGQIQNYMMRVNMSILVVAMAKNEPTSSKNVTTNTTEQACMEGIVIWLVAAQSVIQSPVWALDSNFRNTFSLF